MFSLDIVDTDRFLDMPLSAQSLYFHLGMRADDDGFVASPRKITTLLGAAPDDMKILIGKGFVIPFESGVCVITDWKQNNFIQKDRYKPTIYLEERDRLLIRENGSYALRIQNGSRLDPQISIDQYSVDQYSTEQQQPEKTVVVVSGAGKKPSKPKRQTVKKQETLPDVSGLSFLEGPSDRDKASVLNAANGDVETVRAAYGMAKAQGGIESLTAWLIAMVKKIQNGEVSPPVNTKRQAVNRFNNFEGREIDFAELERLELEQLKEAMKGKDGEFRNSSDDM